MRLPKIESGKTHCRKMKRKIKPTSIVIGKIKPLDNLQTFVLNNKHNLMIILGKIVPLYIDEI